MQLEEKLINGFERISEALKFLLREQAKTYGISPIQIQILLFVSDHRIDLCNVSHLAKEFNVTKATISDAVKVLLQKQLVEKDYSPTDNRRYNLLVTSAGQELVERMSSYASSISKEFSDFDRTKLEDVFDTLSKLIFRLNQRGIIQVQRTCFNCTHYGGDRNTVHFCNLMERELKVQDIRLDCAEFEERASS